MENKICVYAICKNESKFIDRWLKSMSEADYIVVLDTGSTDGTYEILQKDPRVTRVEQKVIKPWRFDVARNESMTLVPDDATVLVCTDFDEIFEAGWANVLRSVWSERYTKCYYTYAWSHNENGVPGDEFTYDKIHSRDYHWVFPVHEVLMKNDPNFEESIVSVGDKIYLHHLPDKTKSRSNYMDLLKLSVKENPDDSHVQMLLAREYLLYKDTDNALKEYLKVLDMEDMSEGKAITLETYGRLANLYAEKNDLGECIKYCYKFIAQDPTYREPYFIMASVFIDLGQYEFAKSILETAFKVSTHKYIWVERAPMWQDLGYKFLGRCYWNLNELDKAIENYQTAYKINPNDKETCKALIELLLHERNKGNG